MLKQTQVIFTRFTLILVTLCSLSLLSSCEDDDYMEDQLIGSWRVVESSSFSPYYPNDYFLLRANGSAQVTTSFEDEYFYNWNVSHNMLYFEGNGYSLQCRIRSYQGDYLSLDVYDTDQQSRYTLRLVRDNYYYSKKR